MSRLWRGRTRDEEGGAVAVMMAVLVLVLVSVASLAVDLGQAWARVREVQKQADVSAIGAASLLPMKTTAASGHTPNDIARRAAALLLQNEAVAQMNNGMTVTQLAANLLDGDTTNGSLTFQNASGAACTNLCVRLTLTPPQANVDYGLADVMGVSGAHVARPATVEVFSELPDKKQVVPLWLPSGCGYGPIDGDSSGGSSSTTTAAATATTPATTSATASTSAATASATATATATGTAAPVAISPRGTHVLAGSSPVAAAAGQTRVILNYSITGVPANTAKASIRLVSPDGTYYIEYATSAEPKQGTMTVPPFEVGTEITSKPGDWKSYAIISEQGINKPQQYSSNNLVVRVTGSAPTTSAAPTTTAPTTSAPVTTTTATATASSTLTVPVGCAGSARGNFGQMFSPRIDTTNKQKALARNLAFGLDHTPIPFDTVNYTVEKECAASNGAGKIAGAQLDDVSREGNNCIIGDSGNDGPRLFDGLVDAVDGVPGRLNVAGGADRNTNPACGRSNMAIGSRTINNDVLSCFLRNGATLADIAKDTGVTSDMLDVSVTKSPRFVYLPVVMATDRAQHGYQPIVDYVPAFITDETQTTAATSQNGLDINGNSIKVIRAFAFNKAALPVREQSPVNPYSTTLDRPIVRLVG